MDSNFHGCDGNWSATVPLVWGNNEFQLRAAGNSGNTRQLNATLRRQPESPDNTSVSISGDTVIITWSDVAQASSYAIYYSTLPDINTGEQALHIDNVTSPHTFTLPQPGTTYYIAVAAKHGDIVGFLSEEHVLTTGWYWFTLNDLVNQDDIGTPLIAADVYDRLHIISGDSYLTDSPGYWIDVPFHATDYRPMAIDSDSNGRPHFVLKNTTSIVYAYLDSQGTWTTSVLDDILGVNKVLLAIDVYDHAHIVYQKDASIIYLTDTSGQWVEMRISVDSSIVIVSDNDRYLYGNQRHLQITATAVDSAGRLHMVYTTSPTSSSYSTDSWYTTNQRGYWENTRLLSRFGFSVRYATVTVDDNDIVHFSYKSTYVSKSGATWSNKILLPDFMYRVALEIDNNNHVHIVGQSSSELIYVNNLNGRFEANLLLEADENIQDVDIAIDSDTNVYITYSIFGYVGSAWGKKPFYITNKPQ